MICVLCDFEFEPELNATYSVSGERLAPFEGEFIVSWCEEHDTVCCPMCNGCQAVEPTVKQVSYRRARRWHHQLSALPD